MIAVLTGDIISSRTLPNRSRWLRRLEEIIEKKSGLAKPPKWGVFRGDSFQVELSRPQDALRLAILIRAGLRSTPGFSPIRLDARIAIGIGDKGYSGKSVHYSDGEAYVLSGTALDVLKRENSRLTIQTPGFTIGKSLEISLQLASTIIDDWSFAEAQAVWLKLSENKTQEEIAKKLKISQPAVHKRYTGSHYNEISKLLTYFESAVSSEPEGLMTLQQKK
ncbi:MAG TPA: hypothetical protein VFE50_12065 [Cyclobacteriaceae bacterium]|nr:hypothetical protein [Cyclobacteriaceae bacterium]